MANLRDLIDAKAVDTQDTGDVYKHLENTKRSQLSYKMDKLKLHNKLAPTRQLLDLVDQEHPLDSNNPMNLQNPQLDQSGNPIPNTGQQPRPGMQTNPNNDMQQTNQNMKQAGQQKPGFPNANKTSTTNKLSQSKNGSSKPTDNKSKSNDKKGRFEIHVKAGGPREAEGSSIKSQKERIDQLNVKKKKMKGNDYHSNPGVDQGAGRAIGLSGGGPGSGRHAEGTPKVKYGGGFRAVPSGMQNTLDKIHSTLSKHGFKYSHTDDDYGRGNEHVFTKSGGHEVQVNAKNGNNWNYNHFGKGEASADNSKSGGGLGSLHSHLKRLQ